MFDLEKAHLLAGGTSKASQASLAYLGHLWGCGTVSRGTRGKQKNLYKAKKEFVHQLTQL